MLCGTEQNSMGNSKLDLLGTLDSFPVKHSLGIKRKITTYLEEDCFGMMMGETPKQTLEENLRGNSRMSS